MALTQTEFCRILSRLNDQRSGALAAASAASYGLGRLTGALQLARRQVEDEIQSAIPRGVTLPVDTNLYTQLIATCPGLLPPLPADAARAAVILSALQALLQSETPGALLNTMIGNPAARLARVTGLLQGMVSQVRAIADAARNGGSLKIPGTAGEIGSALASIVKSEATALASRALFEALEKAGVNAEAAQRCAGRLCAVGVPYNPPG